MEKGYKILVYELEAEKTTRAAEIEKIAALVEEAINA